MRFHIFSDSYCPVLNLLSIGYASDPAVTRFGPSVRSYYIIHYVLNGKGYFNGNPVKKGQGFLITPNMKEHYYPDRDDPWDFLWVTSDDNKTQRIFEEINADPFSNIFTFNHIDTVKDTTEFIIKNNNKMYSGYEMLEIFLNILKYHQKQLSPNEIKTNAKIYIEAAEKYVRLNMQKHITVSELTEFLGVSQPYLFKIFKSEFSLSPKQYITDQKLKQAKKLLLETDLSVTNIANSVGFSDVLSFSKCFKSIMKISPKNYRSEIKRKNLH